MPQYFLSCPKGLEEMLEQEARSLLNETIEGLKQEDGGIKINTSPEHFIMLLLSTRLGSRGHLQLGQWPFHELRDLTGLANDIAFEEIMDLNQTFKINTLFDPLAKRELRNSIVASQMFKDGLVDRFREKLGRRPNVELTYPDMTFLLRIEGARNAKKLAPFMLTLYCDITGAPLSNRSYRINDHVAPLRENVAASLVYKATIEQDDTFFFDPFCGTGTILAEAAMIKAKAIPSFLNLPQWQHYYTFARQRWFKQDKALKEKIDQWARLQFDLGRKGLSNLPGDFFFGSDLDQDAINTSKRTMAILGIDKKVQLKCADALKVKPPKETKGLIICNPPYGERLATPEAAIELYGNFTEHLKADFKGHRAYILAGDPKAHTHIHLKTSCKMPVYNGDIDCRLLGYKLF